MILFLGNSHSTELYSDIIEESKNDRDIIVSCQYVHKVPESIVRSRTCVNIHYGILPFFAGCNPIYWQIMKGQEAGVTLHYMDKNFDSGDIIAVSKIPIGDMTADELYCELSKMGKNLFKRYYKSIVDGTAPRKKQDLSFRNYYPKKAVDFQREKYCRDDRKVRALHFKGKQHPIITIGKRDYELHAISRRNSCL